MGNPPVHRPRKRFGQNFLHDPQVIQRIVDNIRPRAGQAMVEIGPGEGALTAELLPLLGQLDVVELDRDLIPLLETRLAGLGELRIHQADALKFDFCQLSPGPAQLRVVGNLPYNISTPLLFHLLDMSHCIQDMHFMLQKEVVERITAQPGSGQYGRLSVMMQYHCQTEMLFTVGPGAFRPAPKVDSAIVRLTPHRQPPVAVEVDRLAQLVSRAFAQRRKTLRNNLKGLLDTSAIEAAGIDPGIRPERLSLEEFARLAEHLQN
jgi:16S rRNA (adenine1518-N6/adenine1519-N6)-dimethyltransferase